MFKIIFAIIFNVCAGALLATIGGFSAGAGAAAGLVLGMIMPAIPGLKATVFREVWTGETIKAFRNSVESIGWLNKLVDKSKYVDNNVINFVDLGGDPDVLVNNTSYPLEVQELEDGDKAVTLDKYQTKPTPITDDEIYASSYDKMASVIERHRENIDEVKVSRALHSLSPASDKATTPVILTTGDNAEDGTRKKITRKDIIALKKAFDKQKVPIAGRILVLCPDHAADLLENDQKFADQYHNYKSGKIHDMYSFEIYEYVDSPLFDATTKTKKAYGSVAGENDFPASIAFHAKNCIRMEGMTKAYLSEAKNDPKTQQNLYNARHYFMALPLKERAMAAIVSAKVA